MTNPFKKVALALLLRGGIFALLALILLAGTVPSLINVGQDLNVPGVVAGMLLLTVGIFDIVHGVQRLTRLRKDKLETASIDRAYGNAKNKQALPDRLMNADENPNEAGLASIIQWLSRVFPRLAFLPYPYTGALHSVLVAVGLGALGIAVFVMLRIVMAGSSGDAQLIVMLDWYLWLYFVIGFGFWAAASRFGLRRALAFEDRLLPGKIVTLFLTLLLAAVAVAIVMSRSGTELQQPPPLGVLVPILCAGSLLVIGSTIALVFLRSRHAPDSYTVHRGEEFFTVGMHPTDIINVIKSVTGKLGNGGFVHLGSWKPDFKEHTAVHAGEFEASLNAESAINIDDSTGSRPEVGLGTLLAWLGVALTLVAGVILWQQAGNSASAITLANEQLRLSLALAIFGALLYRLGVIPVSELSWTSIATRCDLEGTFQAQGGMALMNSGDQSLKGSVLTSATVQPKCAYLTSVGYLQPGFASQTIVRVVDRVEPAEQIANDILTRIRHQATQMMSAGAPAAPAQLVELAEEPPPDDSDAADPPA